LPLEDGRLLSLEGRTLEFLYDKVVGKIAALDIVDIDTGKIILNAGKKITKNDAEEICSKHIDIIRVRTNNKSISVNLIEI